MLIKDLLNFQLPQSRELFSGRFMIGNAQIIANAQINALGKWTNHR